MRVQPALTDENETEPRAAAHNGDLMGAPLPRVPLGAILALVVACGAVYATAVVGLPFYTKGEPREAIVVQRIVDRRELVLPRRTDTEIPTKPPLFHWLGALASTLAGDVSEASVRAPSLAASLLTIALTALAGAYAFGATAGLTAGAVLATSQQWIASSVTARVDMVLAATVSVAMLALLRARLRGAPFPDAFWVACAAAVLAKGPVGLALPLLTAATFLAVERDLGYFATMRPLRAAAALAIPLVWYVAAWRIGGDEFFDEVVAENVQRMVDADAGEVGHEHSAAFYLPALLGAFAPWSLLVVPAVAAWWRGRPHAGRDEIRANARRARAFALVWAATTVAFYSLADSKRPVYLLSCFPALSLLAGDWLARRFDAGEAAPRPSPVLTWSGRVLGAALGVAVAIVALQSIGIATFEVFAPLVSPGDAANLAAVARSLEARPIAVGAWLAACAALAVALQRAAARGSARGAFLAVVALIAATATLVSLTFFRDLARTQSVAPFLRTAVAALPDAAPLYYYPGRGEIPELSFARSFEYAATFYARRPLTVIDDLEDVRDAERFALILPQPALDVLRPFGAADAAGANAAADARPAYSFRELARYTYGGNPRRVPVVLVEAHRVAAHGDSRALGHGEAGYIDR